VIGGLDKLLGFICLFKIDRKASFGQAVMFGAARRLSPVCHFPCRAAGGGQSKYGVGRPGCFSAPLANNQPGFMVSTNPTPHALTPIRSQPPRGTGGGGRAETGRTISG
jgi:hypothetical protein